MTVLAINLTPMISIFPIISLPPFLVSASLGARSRSASQLLRNQIGATPENRRARQNAIVQVAMRSYWAAGLLLSLRAVLGKIPAVSLGAGISGLVNA